MEIIIKSDYSEISSDSAMIVANQIKAKPNTVLGLATGSTPLGLYKELIRFHLNEGLDFSNVISVAEISNSSALRPKVKKYNKKNIIILFLICMN